MRYPKVKIPKLVLNDIRAHLNAYESTSGKMQRIQVVMPIPVVKALDTLYPSIDRSRILSKLAMEEILRQCEISDKYLHNEEIAELVNEEQYDLDTMYSYLVETEKEK